MIGKVQLDSFQGLGIRVDSDSEPLSPHGLHHHHPPSHLLSTAREGDGSHIPPPGESLGSLLRDCQVGLGRPLVSSRQTSSSNRDFSTTSSSAASPTSSSPKSSPSSPLPPQSQSQPSSRYKTELCRPYQEHGSCKYGEKCQFAHGHAELRNVNRHPKYKTDLCRTYHSVGFCPYGPRCHFIHALDELRSAPVSPQEKKSPGTVKQLPMYGGPPSSASGSGNSRDFSGNNWTFPPPGGNNNNNNNNTPSSTSMKTASAQLGKFFNLNTAGHVQQQHSRDFSTSGNSTDSSRSSSLCSELDNLSINSGGNSPDSSCASSPLDVSRNLRLPIFNRLA